MQPDQYLVLGLFLVVISIPAMISAYSENRAPWVGAGIGVIAIAALAYGYIEKPGGYQLADIPAAIYSVIGAVIR